MSHFKVAPGCCVICIPCAGVMECVNLTVQSVFCTEEFECVGVGARELGPGDIEQLLGDRRRPGYAEKYVQFSGGISMVMVLRRRVASDDPIDEILSEGMLTVRRMHASIGAETFFPCFVPVREKWMSFAGVYGLNPVVLAETAEA